MKSIMPQEIEVWYILPAIRRELAKMMVNDYKLSQKGAAKLLKITESAVSQYFKSKRAKDIRFSEEILSSIRKAAKRIIEKNNLLIGEIQHLCELVKKDEVVCKLHRDHDKTLPVNCGVCLKSLGEVKNAEDLS